MSKVVFEIEDYFGNTTMTFEVDVEKLAKDTSNYDAITQTKDCDVADVTFDYTFESEAPLFRIQSNIKGDEQYE